MNGGAKSYLEVDSSGFRLKGDLLYLPRSNKAQSLGKQRFNHEEPIERKGRDCPPGRGRQTASLGPEEA